MRKWPIFFLMTIACVSRGNAQVQVSQEPRHHKVLENEWVRVLDVHIPPHDTTLMHKHSTPSVFIVLSNTKTGSEALIEPGKPAFTAGDIWFEGFYDKPRIHRVWNEDTVEFHVMDIELLHAPAPPSALNRAVSIPFSESLFDERPVHAFKVTLDAGMGFSSKVLKAPVLVVGLSGPDAASLVNGQHFSGKGDFVFIPAGSNIEIWNESKTLAEQFALLYLK